MDYESYGVWVDGEHIGIYPHKLSEVLKKEGFSEHSVLKEWSNRNWIKRHDNKHFSIVVAINHAGELKRRRVISISWDIVEKYLE
jgi:hypothetical protein